MKATLDLGKIFSTLLVSVFIGCGNMSDESIIQDSVIGDSADLVDLFPTQEHEFGCNKPATFDIKKPDGNITLRLISQDQDKGELVGCMDLPDSEASSDVSCLFKPKAGWSGAYSFDYSIASNDGAFPSGKSKVSIKIVACKPIQLKPSLIFNRTAPSTIQGFDSRGQLLVQGSNIYISSRNRLYVSSNLGLSFTELNNSGLDADTYIDQINLDSLGNFLLPTRIGLYRSVNNQPYQRLNQTVDMDVGAVIIDKNEIFAHTNGVQFGERLLISRNNGQSFEMVPLDLGVFPRLALSGSLLYVGTDSGLAISLDKGRNFSQKAIPTKVGSTRALAAEGDNVYLGAENGLFISRDRGQTFILSPDFTNISVSVIHESNGILFVGTSNSAEKNLGVSLDQGKSFVFYTRLQIGSSFDISSNIYYVDGRIYLTPSQSTGRVPGLESILTISDPIY